MSRMSTSQRSGWVVSALLVMALGAAAPAARAGDPALVPVRTLLAPGSVVPGSPVGDVAFAPLRSVYGGDGWVMDVTFDGYIEQVVAEHGLGVHEGQVLAGGEVVDEILISIDGDSSGRLASTVLLESGETAVTLDDQLALASGDTLTAAGIEPGSTWSQVSAVDLDDSDHLTVLGRLSEPSDPGTPLEALVRFDIGPAGALLNPTVVLSAHDLVDGRPIDKVGSTSDLTFAQNAAGQLMHTVHFTDPGANGTPPSAIVLDGVVLAEDGLPSPIAGRDWIVGYGDPVSLGAGGDYAYLTHIDAGILASAQVVVYDGAVVALQGAPVPGVPGATIDFISAPRVADDGTLLVLMQWDDPVTSFTTFGFFVDGQLVVQTYATQGDGVQLTYLNNTALSYDLAPDGSRFSFVAYPWTGGWGAYEVPTGPWQSLGNGLAGTAGATPSLFPLGSLEVGEPVSLELAGALPGSSTALIIGTSTVNAPFKGGVLVPSPELVLAGLPLDGSGALTLAATFPPGLPSGVSLAFQFWTVDAGAPAGFSASNAVEGTTP